MPRRTLALLSFVVALHVAADPAKPLTLPIGAPAPALDVRFLDGSKAKPWRELRGRVVVLDFWASWCSPCVAAIPHLDALKRELANEPVDIISVTYEPKPKTEAFLAKHPMATNVALDHDLATFTAYLAWGIPMAYVIDKDGNVASVVYPAKLTAAVIRDVMAGRKPDVEQEQGWSDPEGAAKYFRQQLEADRKQFGSNEP